jgi:hypothetical protein
MGCHVLHVVPQAGYDANLVLSQFDDIRLPSIMWKRNEQLSPKSIYERPVPIRPSSFIRIAGILLKRLLLVVVDEFADEGDEA